MKAEHIKNKIIAMAPEIFSEFKVLFAYLYGSVALGQHHRFSDLDIGVYTQKRSLSASRKLELDLSLAIDDKLVNALESDVRIMNALPLAIAGEIVTEGILIYCQDEDQRIAYETKIRMAYFDFYPMIRSYQKTYMEQIQMY
ncbi:type VII toxin-antitoxin system MntA family adenylyltransferase antitoxin [Desulfosarcina ovata]|uniref:type VII toxin-antitoxin system MntA family adenylyltransferase antitoxin n=1 Tax=Desulfosarcina ovata TaxID=83564 RepID=UPI0012D33A31|nr:nucleotidyltransferase domain-containing protein [Desulfosarcina ovata]